MILVSVVEVVGVVAKRSGECQVKQRQTNKRTKVGKTKRANDHFLGSNLILSCAGCLLACVLVCTCLIAPFVKLHGIKRRKDSFGILSILKNLRWGRHCNSKTDKSTE